MEKIDLKIGDTIFTDEGISGNDSIWGNTNNVFIKWDQVVDIVDLKGIYIEYISEDDEIKTMPARTNWLKRKKELFKIWDDVLIERVKKEKKIDVQFSSKKKCMSIRKTILFSLLYLLGQFSGLTYLIKNKVDLNTDTLVLAGLSSIYLVFFLSSFIFYLACPYRLRMLIRKYKKIFIWKESVVVENSEGAQREINFVKGDYLSQNEIVVGGEKIIFDAMLKISKDRIFKILLIIKAKKLGVPIIVNKKHLNSVARLILFWPLLFIGIRWFGISMSNFDINIVDDLIYYTNITFLVFCVGAVIIFLDNYFKVREFRKLEKRAEIIKEELGW